MNIGLLNQIKSSNRSIREPFKPFRLAFNGYLL